MKYLTIGTNEITEEKFRPIQDSKGTLKPTGGLWLTEQNIEDTSYNKWISYILSDENKYVFYFKYNKDNNWNIPCSLVTLKKDSKIYELDDKSKLQYLMENYKSDNLFTFEGLSKNYDGIFIRPFGMIHREINWEISNKFFTFGVDTLLLFNLNCIDFYQRGNVDIVPFEPEDNLEESDDSYSDEPRYTIKYEEKIKMKILKR